MSALSLDATPSGAIDYESAFRRERAARKQAELLLETKARELYAANQELSVSVRELQRRSGELELLHATALVATRAADTKAIIEHFVKAFCTSFACPFGVAYLRGDEGFTPMSSYCCGEAFCAVTPQMPADEEGDTAQLLRATASTGRVVWIDDTQWNRAFCRARQFPESFSGHLVAVPVHAQASLHAVLAFVVPDKHPDREHVVSFLETATLQLGQALDRRLAESNVERNFAELAQANKQMAEMQGQLWQSEKMASLGQLAAGVAHEINNPVGYVNANLSTLEDYVRRLLTIIGEYDAIAATLAPDAKARIDDVRVASDYDYLKGDITSLVAESREGLERVKKIVTDLKGFSHVDREAETCYDLHEGLTSTLNIAHNEIKYKADVVTRYGTLPKVRCYPGEINQVFMNLLVNAAQAIREKGVIEVETFADEDYACVRIRDNGVGIDAANLKKIFDPFFTTKPVGKGTGLGLSISYNIIQKHKGHIVAESTPGIGTSFVIKLPIEPQEKAGGKYE